MKAEDQIKQIIDARKRGFVAGNYYLRGDGSRMVEITPGHFVNEAKAREFGVRVKTAGQEAAR
jgi:phage/plasmid primase-like uncharacterized protein